MFVSLMLLFVCTVKCEGDNTLLEGVVFYLSSPPENILDPLFVEMNGEP